MNGKRCVYCRRVGTRGFWYSIDPGKPGYRCSNRNACGRRAVARIEATRPAPAEGLCASCSQPIKQVEGKWLHSGKDYNPWFSPHAPRPGEEAS